jgi:hypothetical protein
MPHFQLVVEDGEALGTVELGRPDNPPGSVIPGGRGRSSLRVLEVMARAGHRSMATTRQYLHLAGVVFPEKAAALEQHLLGGRTFYPTDSTSDDQAAPEPSVTAVSRVA